MIKCCENHVTQTISSNIHTSPLLQKHFRQHREIKGLLGAIVQSHSMTEPPEVSSYPHSLTPGASVAKGP